MAVRAATHLPAHAVVHTITDYTDHSEGNQEYMQAAGPKQDERGTTATCTDEYTPTHMSHRLGLGTQPLGQGSLITPRAVSKDRLTMDKTTCDYITGSPIQLDAGDNNTVLPSHTSQVGQHSDVMIAQAINYPSEAERDIPEFMVNMDYPHLSQLESPPTPPPPDETECILDSLYTAEQQPLTYTEAKGDCYAGWPHPTLQIDGDTAALYEAARLAASTGKSPPCLDHTTDLVTAAWELEQTGHPSDQLVMHGIMYGFSTQYTGPPLVGPSATYNHQSAIQFPGFIKDYITKEMAAGALAGPYTLPPFTPWFKASPMMSREKSTGEGRRIIVDLSYPDGGINLYIAPHIYNGQDAAHNLPTVGSAIATIAATPPGDIHMAVVDLSRAYRQFPISPLNWPLLGVYWDDAWAFDRRLPFGSRMSSFVMQTLAEFIVRALARRAVASHMYLDDVIIISPTTGKARRDMDATLALLEWPPTSSSNRPRESHGEVSTSI